MTVPPPPNWVFSMFSFVGFVFVSVPMYWHLEAWNTGTCLYMAWTGIECLNLFINSIVWNNNAINWNPVWCDISTRITIGVNVAIPAASLCINRRLYHISMVKTVTRTLAEKRRAIMVDLAIGLGIPLVQMIIQYVVQGHRFNIFEDIGCYPFTWNVTLAYPLVFVWPLVISVISAVYCILTIMAFAKRGREFSELLASNRNLTFSRYFRLMALAGIELLCGIPLTSFSLYLNASSDISPWKSWADTHSGFSRVDQIPAIIWKSNSSLTSSLELSRWLVVLCAFIFFGFFGFADEARKHYRAAFYAVAAKLGFSPPPTGSALYGSSGYKGSGPSPQMSNSSRGVVLPSINTSAKAKNHSITSLSDQLSTSIYIGDFDEKNEKGLQGYSPADAHSPSSAGSASTLPTPADDLTRHDDLLRPPALMRPERALPPAPARRPSSVYSDYEIFEESKPHGPEAV
ncbi:STE3-domain-containing protein [Heliocybe sulcata]|uniref:STE3-domain-containing protein n=1 Tax=Heliocybe sulcata TaxID=5364 RepID=A0A5C3MZ21_9AGAM|nr:STE3-domain-containing protein [Heliocybe sulcata]